jgi:hypothetical protein
LTTAALHLIHIHSYQMVAHRFVEGHLRKGGNVAMNAIPAHHLSSIIEQPAGPRRSVASREDAERADVVVFLWVPAIPGNPAAAVRLHRSASERAL